MRLSRLISVWIVLCGSAIHVNSEEVWISTECNEASCPDVCQSGIIASAEFLNWKPVTRGSDFAISEDGTATTIGVGRIHDVTYGSDTGVRGRLGYQTATKWSVSLGYTYFDTEGAAHAERPAGVGQLFATQSHPDGNEEADSADALISIDYSVFDLIIERPVFQNRFTDMRVFGGVRWADIARRSDVRYDGRDFVNALVNKRSAMRGAGLRMGTQSSWLVAGGFQLFGGISGGLLFSETLTNYYETNFDDTVVLVDIQHGQDGATPFLECQAGVGWQYNRFSVQAGYELQNWFGLHERSMFVDDIHEATFANISEDLLLTGLFVRSSISW
ncbi:MAG: hypothetical protein KDB27_24845 [Planctomycetales bacterium]|nr:hypothetical protein [Planctomycetales bacterium]